MYSLWNWCWICLIPLHPAVWQHKPVPSALPCIQPPWAADSSSNTVWALQEAGESTETVRARAMHWNKAMATYWENSITDCWAFHISRKDTKHFNGHIPTTVASVCWFVQASLSFTWKSICFSFPYVSGHSDDLSPIFVVLCEMAICFLFPMFHVFQVQVYTLLSICLKIMHIPIDLQDHYYCYYYCFGSANF